MTQLNQPNDYRWILVDNSQASSESIVDSNDDRAVVINGADPNAGIAGWGRGSFHHAAGLNKGKAHIKTRFALFLDPDFYIVRPQWINDVISHMKCYDLGFFGVPWHPRWYSKWRYFPCAHFLLVDLSKIPLESLDFTPQHPNALLRTKNQESFGQRVTRRLRYEVMKVPISVLKNRVSIAQSHDTGYPNFVRYSGRRDLRYQGPTPVFRLPSEFRGPAWALTRWGRLVERLLPERLCYLPKKKGSYTQTGFQELGIPEVSVAGWEEFVWKGAPFGFHLRRFRSIKPDPHQERAFLVSLLDNLMKSADSVAQ